MKHSIVSAFVGALAALLFACALWGSYRYGQSQQAIADASQISELSQWKSLYPRQAQTPQAFKRQVDELIQSKSEGWFTASQETAQLNTCQVTLQQIAQAKQAQKTQGTEAALKILALLLR